MSYDAELQLVLGDLYRLLSADRIDVRCRIELLREGRRMSVEVIPRERR